MWRRRTLLKIKNRKLMTRRCNANSTIYCKSAHHNLKKWRLTTAKVTCPQRRQRSINAISKPLNSQCPSTVMFLLANTTESCTCSSNSHRTKQVMLKWVPTAPTSPTSPTSRTTFQTSQWSPRQPRKDSNKATKPLPKLVDHPTVEICQSAHRCRISSSSALWDLSTNRKHRLSAGNHLRHPRCPKLWWSRKAIIRRIAVKCKSAKRIR